MTRIVMLGISGLDADLLRVYGPCLPDLRRLLLQSHFLEMRSCFPPEPAPAWASIYTGLHPANHGILRRVDSLQNGSDTPCGCLVRPCQHHSIHGHPQEASLLGAVSRIPPMATFWSEASGSG